MEDEKQGEIIATGIAGPKTRRKVITSAAQVGVTTAAVTLLLGAATKPASASAMYDPASFNVGGARSSNSVDTETGADDPVNAHGDLGGGTDDVPGSTGA